MDFRRNRKIYGSVFSFGDALFSPDAVFYALDRFTHFMFVKTGASRDPVLEPMLFMRRQFLIPAEQFP